ncbi:hypothetical protein L210DRAFT_3649054 [Boletus edulis BED1]|uniref:RING-type domain-containing protein n=1 Tax=Boletus edulis BED1 TaxID=1328754 RepID=A0AAD4GBH5_BOLED|nr:hypothetical protein L210DRAFT_3649054 [Boletus edulis BED1]
MHKHSVSVPLIPASAPTSPAAPRLNRVERAFGLPVTPQRIIRPQKALYRSPVTPASTTSTPYTPLSLRSFSTNSSSTLNTPDSAASFKQFPGIHYPENEITFQLANKCLTDTAASWRSRANENGIRVAAAEDSSFGDDEVPIPVPIISYHLVALMTARLHLLTHTYTSAASDLTPSDASSIYFANEEPLLSPPFLPNHRRSRTQSSIHPVCPSASAHSHRTPARRALGILNTPPPKPTNSSQLKFKGSMTDPAHTRRRPSFDQVSTDLFDIDENAFEPYPQSFSSAAQTLVLQDPFNGSGLSTIAESVPQHLRNSCSEMFNVSSAKSPHTTCSVCGCAGDRMAVLVPCKHLLCSACMTSALNIVGEKDIHCAVCKTFVNDFELQTVSDDDASASTASQRRLPVDIISPLQQRSVRGGPTLLPSTFGPSPLPSLMSTMSLHNPQLRHASPFSISPQAQRVENVVLRIDNVPWDITPSVVAAWLRHPIIRVHILLDPRGKTCSHAYVELSTEEIARAALRSVQNSVLGKGKRARGVTVTLSNQSELMHALFPSWKGNWNGSRPTISGLRDELPCLMSEPELDSLLNLIQRPDSHFLKVPSLPFHLLISILSKFPADVDSRVFWEVTISDSLFYITHTALDILGARYRQSAPQDEPGLLDEFLEAAINCREEQITTLTTIRKAYISAFSAQHDYSTTHVQPPLMPVMWDLSSAGSPPYGALAREFGLPENVVHALAQRLNGFR